MSLAKMIGLGLVFALSATSAYGFKLEKVKGSPFENVGFQAGDELIEIESGKKPTAKDVMEMMMAIKKGKSYQVLMKRGDEDVMVTLKWGKK